MWRVRQSLSEAACVFERNQEVKGLPAKRPPKGMASVAGEGL